MNGFFKNLMNELNNFNLSETYKENRLREKMIKYYDTINQGKVAIPSFILAGYAIENIKKQGRIEDLYKNLLKSEV